MNLKELSTLLTTNNIAIVSAMRGAESPTFSGKGLTPKEINEVNAKNTEKLKENIEREGLAYAQLFGQYPEKTEDGHELVREISFLVWSDDESLDKMVPKFAIRQGVIFDQDSVLVKLKGENKQAVLFFTNHTGDEPYGSSVPIGTFDPNSDSEWASTIQDSGEKFAFS